MDDYERDERLAIQTEATAPEGEWPFRLDVKKPRRETWAELKREFSAPWMGVV